MYNNETNSRFSFRDVVLQFLFVALFIFILLWLFPMKSDFNKLKTSIDELSQNSLKLTSDSNGELNLAVLYDRIFNENVIAMKDAAKSYYTTPRLPQKVGEKVKMTLGEMLSKKIILPFTDKNGKTCDSDESYVEITKYDDEFVMKVNLKCGDDENYLLVYMGCYDYCQTAICEKNQVDIKKPTVYTTKKPTTTSNKPTDTKKPTIGTPSCSLTVSSGTLGTNGAYKSDVVVKFKSKNGGTNSSISAYGIGTSTNYKGDSTYKVTKDGTTVVYGYVKNANGKTGKCSITIRKQKEQTVKPTVKNPTCELTVTRGIKGNNNWYTSDVVVGFKSKTANTSGAKIVSYGIGTSETYNNNANYTITKDGTLTLKGYVKDSNGNTGSCNITVKRDATKPTCSIAIGKGTQATDGKFISNVLLGFKTRSDATSGVATYGIGYSKKYDKSNTITVSNLGTTIVYGYVKDNAGNEIVCNRAVSLRAPTTATTTCSWTNWSSWSTTAYQATSTREVRWQKVLKGYNVKTIQDTSKPIFKTKQVYVANKTVKTCASYKYTGKVTYSRLEYVGRVVRTSRPSDTTTVKYVYVGTEPYFCSSSSNCTSGTFFVYDVYKKTVKSSTGSYSCSKWVTDTAAIKANKTVLDGYETKTEKTPVYEMQYSYRDKVCHTVTR